MGPVWVVLLCLAACTWAQQAGAQQQEVQGNTTVVSTGQAFADAVAAWGESGGVRTVLVTSPLLSMDNVTFTNSTASPSSTPFSSGQLTIRGIGSTTPVIDARMKWGLVPQMRSGATIVQDSLVMLNVCAKTWFPSLVLGPLAGLTSASEGGLFQRTRVYQSLVYQDYTLYVRLADLSQQAYLLVLRSATSTFPPLERLTREFIQTAPMTPGNITNLTSYSAHVTLLLPVSARWYNSSIKAVEDPNDPQTRQLRDRGLIMPAQFCNGTLMPPDMAAAKVYASTPAWITSNAPEFMTAMKEAIIFQKNVKAPVWRAPCIVLVTQDLPLTPGDLVTPLPTLDFALLMSGPFNHHPAYFLIPTVNLGNAIGWLPVLPGAVLCMQRLKLTGLAQQPNPLVPGLQSALPLAALPLLNASAFNISQPYLWLSNITLVLPSEDYLAIAALAFNNTSVLSCMKPGIITRAEQLKAGILSITLPSPVSDHVDQEFELETIVGWGMNATRLKLLPDSPVLEFQACQAASTAQGTGSSSKSKNTAILVGSIVGGAGVLVATAAWLMYRARQARRSQAQTAAGSYKSELSSAALAPALGSGGGNDGGGVGGSTRTDRASTGKASSALVSLLTEAEACASVKTRGSPAPDAGYSNNEDRRTPSGSAQLISTGQESDRHSATSQAGQLFNPPQTLLLGSRLPEHAGRVQELADGINHNADKVVITGILGQGSWGSVYRGEWRGLSVAVKTIVFEEQLEASRVGQKGRKGVMAHQQAIMEAAIAASLGHRNVVATYLYDIKPVHTSNDASVVQGLQVLEDPGLFENNESRQATYKVFLVQELCSVALNKVLASKTLINAFNNTVDTAAVYSILLDIAVGLEYLHSKDLVHGDLKPANVLLKLDPEMPDLVICKLADFGLSVHLTADRTHVSNYTSGTPFYVAPEIVAHNRVGKPADIFAFGVIMWQVFTSKPPYIRAEDGGFKWEPSFGSFSLVAPPRLYQRLMRKCLSDAPGDRPTATELISCLQELQIQDVRQHASNAPLYYPSQPVTE